MSSVSSFQVFTFGSTKKVLFQMINRYIGKVDYNTEIQTDEEPKLPITLYLILIEYSFTNVYLCFRFLRSKFSNLVPQKRSVPDDQSVHWKSWLQYWNTNWRGAQVTNYIVSDGCFWWNVVLRTFICVFGFFIPSFVDVRKHLYRKQYS